MYVAILVLQYHFSCALLFLSILFDSSSYVFYL